MRAGIKWREHGEKSSKYFLGRLKSRELARDLHNLIDNNGLVVSGLQGVLTHVKSFFSSLYMAVLAHNPHNDVESFFDNCPVLDPIQRLQLSAPITLTELKETL